MNGRTTIGVLSLTLFMAACGQQGTSAPQTQASTPDNTQVTSRQQGLAPLLVPTGQETIPGQYIVMLKNDAQGNSVSAQSAGSMIKSLGLNPQGVSVKYLYNQSLKGFAGKLSEENLNTLRADSRVKYIEQDGVMHASATQSNATWGLDRTDQKNLPLDTKYNYATTASNVTAYVIDTGIRTTHTQFGGRATWGINEVGDGQDTDCNGHGTHVAGTIGSATYGVAKGVKLVAVKVLGCNGSGSNSGVIAGITWAGNHVSGPSVANMSLGGGASQALDDAVNTAIGKGLVMAVAAGNDNKDACGDSPSRVPAAITVGSSTKTDARSSFSNYGTCVDLFAPGSDITSTWNTDDNATNTISGTSMATPHVTGAAALILAQNPNYTPAQVASAMKSSATSGVLTNVGTGSPNLLLYTGAGTTTPTPPTTPNPPAGGTTYTGSVTNGRSSFQPSSTGFSYTGGTLKANLTGPSGTDFDLYLSKLNGSTWTDVASSEGNTSSESITYTAGSGTYRWEVYSAGGSGNYTLVENK